MRILGLDSSGIVASVAVVEDDVLVAEYTINYKKTHSQTLLPMLDEIVKMTDCSCGWPGIFYRTSYRICNSERAWIGIKETISGNSDSRGTCLQSV